MRRPVATLGPRPDAYPGLEADDAHDALRYAAEAVRESASYEAIFGRGSGHVWRVLA